MVRLGLKVRLGWAVALARRQVSAWQPSDAGNS
jgi:hypothetical protein